MEETEESGIIFIGGSMIHETVKIWHRELSNIGDCEIGENSIVHSHVWIGDGVKIGSGCKIQAFSFIPKGVTIEDNVFIGPRVTFTNDKNPPSGGLGWQPILVRSGASIGAGAVILPGVTIGRGAKVGAGSVVTRDVPDQTLVYGVPAKVGKSLA